MQHEESSTLMTEIPISPEMIEAGIKASADYRYITRDGGAYVSRPCDYVSAIYRAMEAARAKAT